MNYPPGRQEPVVGQVNARLRLSSALRDGPPTAPGELRTFTVVTESGTELTADIWFRCYGVTPASDYLAGGLAGSSPQLATCSVPKRNQTVKLKPRR